MISTRFRHLCDRDTSWPTHKGRPQKIEFEEWNIKTISPSPESFWGDDIQDPNNKVYAISRCSKGIIDRYAKFDYFRPKGKQFPFGGYAGWIDGMQKWTCNEVYLVHDNGEIFLFYGFQHSEAHMQFLGKLVNDHHFTQKALKSVQDFLRRVA